jgi:hypothetical protein
MTDLANYVSNNRFTAAINAIDNEITALQVLVAAIDTTTTSQELINASLVNYVSNARFTAAMVAVNDAIATLSTSLNSLTTRVEVLEAKVNVLENA